MRQALYGDPLARRQYPGRVIIPNRCSVESIASSLRPLIDQAVAAYKRTFQQDLLSVRLLGSVARGDALPGESDIDFVALLHRDAVLEETHALGREAADLERDYPAIARVDLDAVAERNLEEVQRFIFRTDSVRLYGSDHIPDGTQTIERTSLVALVTPSPIELIGSYRPAIEGAHDPSRVRLLSRAIGKDILKVLRGIALQRGADYEVAIGAIYEIVVEVAPEHRNLAARLYRLYRVPSNDKQELLALLGQEQRDLMGPRSSPGEDTSTR